GCLDADAQPGLAADGVVESVAKGDALARGAQCAAGAVADRQLVAEGAVAGGADADLAVEGRAELPHEGAVAGDAAGDGEAVTAEPGPQGVVAHCPQRGRGRPQGRRPGPAHRRFRVAVEGEALGEGLARVLVVMHALVAREEGALAVSLTDVLDA